ncbi:MAG: ATP-binding cassette domain-containing protein, partial [Acidaminococcaceae bacterium]
MAEIIRINNLGYNFGDGWVLHDLSLTVEQGDFVAVIGANGAGKSTLLRLIAQILTPTLGEIYLYREPLALFKNWQKV